MEYPQAHWNGGFSPSLSISLIAGSQHFNVASIGGGQLRLRDARPTPATRASVHFKIDGRLSVYQIDLPEGIDPSHPVQPFVMLPTGEEAVASL
jgi:hypothetical protein